MTNTTNCVNFLHTERNTRMFLHQDVEQVLCLAATTLSLNEHIRSSIFIHLLNYHLYQSKNTLFVNYFHTGIHFGSLCTNTGHPNCIRDICIVPYFFIFSTLSLLIHLIFTTQGSYLFIFYLYLIIILIVFYVLYFVLYFMCTCGLTNVYRNKHYT